MYPTPLQRKGIELNILPPPRKKLDRNGTSFRKIDDRLEGEEKRD
jgi:hypothetical protein